MAVTRPNIYFLLQNPSFEPRNYLQFTVHTLKDNGKREMRNKTISIICLLYKIKILKTHKTMSTYIHRSIECQYIHNYIPLQTRKSTLYGTEAIQISQIKKTDVGKPYKVKPDSPTRDHQQRLVCKGQAHAH